VKDGQESGKSPVVKESIEQIKPVCREDHGRMCMADASTAMMHRIDEKNGSFTVLRFMVIFPILSF
jgi:hypothetical protein